MRHRPAWAPDEVDIERPSTARMYDYYLGGSYNFAADRALAEQTMRAYPDVVHLVRANRAFLRRTVDFLVGEGIDQFLDLGSGIPAGGNVHDVALAANPAARIVYVDSDPVAIAHSAALLAEVPGASVLHADLRDPEAVMADPAVTGLLDFTRPVAILTLATLPFVPDSDEPTQIVAAYRDATVSGSYLALSHGNTDYRPAEVKKAQDVYNQASQTMTLRTRDQIAEFLDGYDLVPPGLVDMTTWRPDPHDTGADPLGGDVTRYSMLAAVGRRP